MPVLRFEDVAGGHIPDLPPHLIPDNTWAEAVNVRFEDGRVSTRPGYRQLSSFAFPDPVSMLKPFVDVATSAQTLVAGTRRDLAKYIASLYGEGTCSVVQGSPEVEISAGADLIAASIHPGDSFRFRKTDGTFSAPYTIQSVNAANGTAAITLTQNVAEDSETNVEYKVKLSWRYITPRHNLTGENIILTNGSPNVDSSGPNNAFASVKNGDFLIVWADDGSGVYHRRWYEVDSVGSADGGTTPNSRIVLKENYEGPTITTTAGGPNDGTGDYEIRKCFSGSAVSRWQAAIFTAPPNPPSFGTQVARMIFVNLSDNNQKWDGASYTTEILGNPAAPPPKAKYVLAVSNHLWLLHLGGDPYAVRWSDYADPENYAADVASTAGGGPLADDPYGITGAQTIQERVVVFKRDSITVFYPTGALPAFAVQTRIKEKGNEVPYATVASENLILFWDRDGLYLFNGADFQEISHGKIWRSFIETFNFDGKETAFGFYSPRSREYYLFYASFSSPNGFPDKAIVVGPNGTFALWEKPEQNENWITAMGESEVGVNVTIDTLPDVFDWGPPESIDLMPWATIDSIGGGGNTLTQWVATFDGKTHQWGIFYSDNGEPYRKFLRSKTHHFGDAESRKVIRAFRLFAEQSGTPFYLELKIRSKLDLMSDFLTMSHFRLRPLQGESLRVPLRTPGRWYEWTLESQNAGEYWVITGWSVDVKPTGKRDSLLAAAPVRVPVSSGGSFLGDGGAPILPGGGGIIRP